MQSAESAWETMFHCASEQIEEPKCSKCGPSSKLPSLENKSSVRVRTNREVIGKEGGKNLAAMDAINSTPMAVFLAQLSGPAPSYCHSHCYNKKQKLIGNQFTSYSRKL